MIHTHVPIYNVLMSDDKNLWNPLLTLFSFPLNLLIKQISFNYIVDLITLSKNCINKEALFIFCIQGRITENISLFSYEPGKSFNDYQSPTFRPTFILPTNLPPEVVEVCGTNRECAFDFTLTDSAEFAAETMELLVIFNSSLAASIKSES